VTRVRARGWSRKPRVWSASTTRSSPFKRERDERAAGRSESAALEAAAATSGRSLLISGLTVMVAMAGMFLSGNKTFMPFATGTMLVVAVAMVGSLTVLPAVLSKLGDRMERVRLLWLPRLEHEPQVTAVAQPAQASVNDSADREGPNRPLPIRFRWRRGASSGLVEGEGIA